MISHPLTIGHLEVSVSASPGIVLADANATAESLLGDSAAAMYLAKGLGRHRIEYFDADQRSLSGQRLANTTALRLAIE